MTPFIQLNLEHRRPSPWTAPPTERDKVLALTGRPPIKPPVDKTPAPIVAKLLADMRAAVK